MNAQAVFCLARNALAQGKKLLWQRAGPSFPIVPIPTGRSLWSQRAKSFAYIGQSAPKVSGTLALALAANSHFEPEGPPISRYEIGGLTTLLLMRLCVY